MQPLKTPATTAPLHPQRRQLLRLGAWLGLAGSAAWLSACGKKPATANPIAAGATVLALGDSLTQGVGAGSDAAYPVLLAERSGWQVVNAGVSGETSQQIAARLPALLQEHRPALVLLCAGGNDWLRRNSAEATQAEIARMLRLCKSEGVPVLLVAVPALNLGAALTGRLQDHPIYASLARDEQVPLLANAWSEVLSDNQLRADQVHANAAGYARFTTLLLAQLKSSGFLAGR